MQFTNKLIKTGEHVILSNKKESRILSALICESISILFEKISIPVSEKENSKRNNQVTSEP